MVVYVYLLVFYKYCLFLFVNIFDNNNNNLLHLYSAFLDTQSALHSKGAISWRPKHPKDALILDQANLQLYWDCLNSLFIIVYSSVFNVLGKNQRILNFNLVIN